MGSFLAIPGPCEICGQPGKKQTSIVDPFSPALKILCKEHWKEYKYGNECIECKAVPTYQVTYGIFYCRQHSHLAEQWKDFIWANKCDVCQKIPTIQSTYGTYYCKEHRT